MRQRINWAVLIGCSFAAVLFLGVLVVSTVQRAAS